MVASLGGHYKDLDFVLLFSVGLIYGPLTKPQTGIFQKQEGV